MDEDLENLKHDIAVAGAAHITDLMPLIPPDEVKRQFVAIIEACIDRDRAERWEAIIVPTNN